MGQAVEMAVRVQVIAELDEKKREALEKTWVRVNQDFGSIFSTLLPGTTAKLEPQEGQSFLNGDHSHRPGMAASTQYMPRIDLIALPTESHALP